MVLKARLSGKNKPIENQRNDFFFCYRCFFEPFPRHHCVIMFKTFRFLKLTAAARNVLQVERNDRRSRKKRADDA